MKTLDSEKVHKENNYRNGHGERRQVVVLFGLGGKSKEQGQTVKQRRNSPVTIATDMTGCHERCRGLKEVKASRQSCTQRDSHTLGDKNSSEEHTCDEAFTLALIIGCNYRS